MLLLYLVKTEISDIRILSHVNKIFSSVSYVVFSNISKDCWIIDIGDFESLNKLIGDYNPKAVFLTHSHYDHIYGLNDICKIYPSIPVHTNANGMCLLKDSCNNLSGYFGSPFIFNSLSSISCVEDRENITFNGNLDIKAVFTPGHNPSCITWIVGDAIFTGDSYIPGFKTLTKLPGGDRQQAIKSERPIQQISKGKTIYPGHKVNIANGNEKL